MYTITEYEPPTREDILREIALLKEKQDELRPMDIGRAIYGTRMAVLQWVLGWSDEKPSEH